MAREVNKEAKFLLVGNKKDLGNIRDVLIKKAECFATENRMRVIEVSAKTKEGINNDLWFKFYLYKLIMPMEEEKPEINLDKKGMLGGRLKNGFGVKSCCEKCCDFF